MKLHKEAHPTLFYTFLGMVVINGLSFAFFPFLLKPVVGVLSMFFYVLIIRFFRNPKRNTPNSEGKVIAPADGQVVVIEKTHEAEYFEDERIQISVFMSPLNVHVNRSPITGTLKYFKYFPGKYLVAWHPKSSTENERTTLVVENEQHIQVLFRQVAGAMARRICWYLKVGDKIGAGEEFGFIKFGSRVDVYLPIGSDVDVELNQKVRGGETVLARLPARA